MTIDETKNRNSCNNSQEPYSSCEDKCYTESGMSEKSKVEKNLFSPWTEDTFFLSESDEKSTQEQSDKTGESAQTFTERRPRMPGEMIGDARFMLRLALYDNHHEFKLLIREGFVQLVSRDQLKRLREGKERRLPIVSYLSKEGWQQDVELAAMIEDEMRRTTLSLDKRRAIIKSLPAVRRWATALDLG